MTDDQFRAWLSTPRVADGAWSSELRRADALPNREPTEFLNVRTPQRVLTLAREYLRAGVDVLSTNTFAATRAAQRERAADDAPAPIALCRAGAQIARQAIGDREILVAGTLGASGAIMAVDEISDADLAASFSESAAALADAGADLIVLETFSELREVRIAITACRAATKLPIVACMSFDSGPQRTRTIAGLEAADAARPLLDAGAAMVGANCGAGFETALPALVALSAAARQPIWLKPSAGLPELIDDRLSYAASPDEFARHLRQWIDAGAGVIGGCCGVGPGHIQRAAHAIEKLRGKSATRRQKPLT